MKDVLCGIDMSGDPDRGNSIFMSIVIGTQEKIVSIVRKLGRENIHMHMLKRKTQDEIVSKLSFGDGECMALCFRIEREKITNEIKNMKKIRTSNTRKRKVFTEYDYTLWSLIQDKVREFLQRHGCDLHDVVFQCDHDSISFLKNVGLRHAYGGLAYMLADIVAWTNTREQEPDGVEFIDLAPHIRKRMKRRMK